MLYVGGNEADRLLSSFFYPKQCQMNISVANIVTFILLGLSTYAVRAICKIWTNAEIAKRILEGVVASDQDLKFHEIQRALKVARMILTALIALALVLFFLIIMSIWS